MEETVGRWWHQALTLAARHEHRSARVHLCDMQHSLGILFRAAGGDAALRLSDASAQRVGGARDWLQRLAGSGQQSPLGRLDTQVLALPASLAVFAQTELNRQLYLWLAVQAACLEPQGDWIADNLAASQRALQQFAGLRGSYQALCAATLASRPDPARLPRDKAAAERAVQAGLRGETVLLRGVLPTDVAPVWLWLTTCAVPLGDDTAFASPRRADAGRLAAQSSQRRQARRTRSAFERPALVLPFRGESLLTWGENVNLDRATDDEDDGNALAAANDIEQLAIAADGQTLASRVRFDLDLPSASADDLPLGPGLRLPEWDYRQGRLLDAHCAVQVRVARPGPTLVPSALLRATARRVSRRLEWLRSAPRWQRAQDSGDEIDLDAWVRFNADCGNGLGRRSDTPPVYARRSRSERSLATLLLADLSLSTDAHASSEARVIDIIRDALFVFGEALAAVGDAFGIWGFSSIRRHQVRLQHLKAFDEPWSALARARVAAIRPGYYTRIGCAVRFATQQLQQRPERRRLLLLLTDGKPNDLDAYEGRYGIEDTRYAVHQARLAGLTPFCVTIDETAHDYLPYLFGQNGYALVHRPQQLVRQLTQAWALLAR